MAEIRRRTEAGAGSTVRLSRRGLAELRPAGIILRRRNFLEGRPYAEWLAEYRELVTELRAVIARENLILCIDHEGGRIVRPPAPITRFPYAAKWADRAEEQSSGQLQRVLCRCYWEH